jgi:hypothetical protein
MINKFFTVEKRLTIAASKQHTAFSSGDVMVDWTALQIPKGASKLVNATALIRPKGDATPTDNNFAFSLLFSKTNTVSLGTVNSATDHRPSNDFIGVVEFDTSNYAVTTLQSTAVAGVGNDAENSTPPLVLQGNPTTGDNVGFDTIYVGMLAQGDFDFTSINAVNEADFGAGTQTVITMDGTGMDVREHFTAGDILHAQDDAILGTVASVDSATQITLTAANTDAIAEDDIIYNINPVKIILGFEK